MRKKIRNFAADMLRATYILWQVDKRNILLNIAVQITQGCLPVLALYYMKAMLDHITGGASTFDKVVYFILMYGLIQLAIALVAQFSTYINNIYQDKLSDHLSASVLVKAVDIQYEYYENPGYHDTLHIAQQQASSRISQLYGIFSSLILTTVSMAGLIAYFLSIHSIFALWFILLSLPLAAVKWYSGQSQYKMLRKFSPVERQSNYLFQLLTSVNPAKEVRTLNFGHNFIEKYRHIRRNIASQKRKEELKFMALSLSAEGFEIGVLILVFFYLAKQVVVKAITIGTFIVYIQGFQRLQSVSKGFLQAWVQLFQQRLFIQDIFAFFDLAVDSEEKGKLDYPPSFDNIAVKNVSFKYPGSSKEVLKDVSMDFKSGKITAIVGANGSGKSTLIKLLARLYDVKNGSLKLDDNPISDFDLSEHRKNWLFVFQDFEKYFFTVEENIAIGEEHIDHEGVEAAAKLSGADQFIQKMQKQYKTRLGRVFEKSEQLSGGQWQKLILSRVFYKKAPIIVLDEPTSALDPNAEHDIFANLKKQQGGRTFIITTHRLYNVKIADYIYVMKDGRIAQEGTFADLTATNGEFKNMYQAQKL